MGIRNSLRSKYTPEYKKNIHMVKQERHAHDFGLKSHLGLKTHKNRRKKHDEYRQHRQQEKAPTAGMGNASVLHCNEVRETHATRW